MLAGWQAGMQAGWQAGRQAAISRLGLRGGTLSHWILKAGPLAGVVNSRGWDPTREQQDPCSRAGARIYEIRKLQAIARDSETCCIQADPRRLVAPEGGLADI